MGCAVGVGCCFGTPLGGKWLFCFLFLRYLNHLLPSPLLISPFPAPYIWSVMYFKQRCLPLVSPVSQTPLTQPFFYTCQLSIKQEVMALLNSCFQIEGVQISGGLQNNPLHCGKKMLEYLLIFSRLKKKKKEIKAYQYSVYMLSLVASLGPYARWPRVTCSLWGVLDEGWLSHHTDSCPHLFTCFQCTARYFSLSSWMGKSADISTMSSGICYILFQ